MSEHDCDIPGCDGTRLGHDLAVDFPEETARIDAAFDRLRGPREDRVMAENLRPRPKRIQRKRTKGWRMPEGAVYVGRGTKWGNPWKPVELSPGRWAAECNGERNGRFSTREQALAWCVVGYRAFGPIDVTPADVRRELAGRDLACWCPLDQPCHADVLLELANGGAS